MRATASKVGLLSQCAHWAREGVEWNRRESDEADLGTRFHKAIATWVTEGGDVPPGDDDTWPLIRSACIWVDQFGREKLAAEVAFAWSPERDTATRILAVDRDYAAGVGCLCGTADLVAISRATRTGYIADWKTGDASQAGPQLRALALMLARAEDLDSVTVEALEVSAEGVRSVCREDLDAFALAAVAGELAESLASVEAAEPQPGPHCGEMYCPARAACPAQLAIVAQVIPAEDLVRHKWELTIRGPDHAAWLLDRARLVGSVVEDVKAAIKAYVPKDGLVLEDGSLLVEGTRNMPRRDNKKLEALARACGATDEQIAGCDYVAVESSGLKLKKPAAAKKRRAA